MNRISRHQLWMEIAQSFSKRATCYRGNVGALIVRDRSIVSAGYNGPGTGERHCTGSSCERTSEGGCMRSYHAEENAITRADDVEGSDIYVTKSPCFRCAGKIADAKIKRVFYAEEYRDLQPIKFLFKVGVKALRLSPNGMMINSITNELIQDEPS